MSSFNFSADRADDDYGSSRREKGARRKKLMGYLKAANELRQTYQQSYMASWNSQRSNDNDYDRGIPGALPDGTVARSGDEEMILFPSYARQHVRRLRRHFGTDTKDYLSDSSNTCNSDSWERNYDDDDEDNAIVDVDVHGWIYCPHNGPLNRRNRILVALARRLSGISTPSNPDNRASNNESIQEDEELIAKEAKSIVRKGEGEKRIATRGDYSETSMHDSDLRNAQRVDGKRSRSISPVSRTKTDSISRQLSRSSMDQLSTPEAENRFSEMRKRGQQSDINDSELSVANARLMSRLKPFMASPLAGIPLTIFFYDDEHSQSRNLMTDEGGHFYARVALDFAPTHIRVLASESLSVTEEVHITEPTGVSLISDIDDTIKHSGIGTGAKEIFRNTFIKDLGELTVPGVKDWYSKLAAMGVKMHYVSNSPWQLYPLLVSYFALAGLPSGSFHLKQYSGMLQGIFEPVAERKKNTLEKLFRDFPDRRFILVGDSGEADLEVYVDIVLTYPGRVLAVFIRDVTTRQQKAFFDQSVRPSTELPVRPVNNFARVYSSSSAMPAATIKQPPSLRPPSDGSISKSTTRENDLINLSDGSMDARPLTAPGKSTTSIKTVPPPPPKKPLSLQAKAKPATSAEDSESKALKTSIIRKPVAPPPLPKPRRSSAALAQGSQKNPCPPDPKPSTIIQSTVLSSQRHSLPRPPPLPPHRQVTRPEQSNLNSSSTSSSSARKSLASYPAAAAQYASSRITNYYNSYNGNTTSSPSLPTSPPGSAGEAQAMSKKEELWLRRWARAEFILEGKGVILKSWRTGNDVLEESVTLVQKELKSYGRNQGNKSGS